MLALAAWRAPFHLHLLKSVPAANATMSAAPDVHPTLVLAATCSLAVTSVKVTGPAARRSRSRRSAAGDSALVVAPVKGTMAAGAYTVVWRTMAKDGHVARGTFAFKVTWEGRAR